MAIPKSGDHSENINLRQNPETGKYWVEGREDLGEADTTEEMQNRLQERPDKPGVPSKQSSVQQPAPGTQQPTVPAQTPPPVPPHAPTPPEQGESATGDPQQGTSLPDLDDNTASNDVPESDKDIHEEEEIQQPITEEGAPQDVHSPIEPKTVSQEQDESDSEESEPVEEQGQAPPPPVQQTGGEEEQGEREPQEQKQEPDSGTKPLDRQEQGTQPVPPILAGQQGNKDGRSPQNKTTPETDSKAEKGRKNAQNLNDSNAMRNTPKSPMGGLKEAAKDKAKEAATDAAKDTKAGEAAEKAVEVADKTRKTFTAIKTGALKVKALVPILTNPYFWLAVLLILSILGAVLFIMASPQVIGRDDNRRVCLDENSINNQIGTMSAADARGRAQEIGDYLTSTHFDALGGPMSVTQAAAFVGNLMVETGGTLNPSIKQGGDTSDMSNSEVRAWSGGRGGRALGIVQWDVGRALNLIDFAESKNAKWNDLELQIEFFTHELNGPEGSGVRNALSQLESSDIETVTLAWDRTFWRSAGYHGQERVGHAVEFLEYYEQGAHSGTHGVTICNDHNLVSMDASNVVDLAISIAVTTGRIEDSHVPSFGFDIFGDAVAPEPYKEANALAFENGGADPYAGGRPVYASCDRFVATVLKATGTDVDVPWGSTGTQLNHYRASDKWEHVTTVTTGEDPVAKGAEAGDVLIRVGHTALYIGTPENASEIGLSPGVPAVADASIMRRVGFVRPFAYMDSPSQRYEVFRCVKDCGDTLEDVT